LLLPELIGIKQAASIIIGRGFCKAGDTLTMGAENITSKLQIGHLVERTARFERFQYSLV
jgi:hypothetical protein